MQSKNGFEQGGIRRSGTSFIKSPERINVAFSRAQNLLIVLGNRFALSKNDVEIIRDNGSKVKKPMYKQIQEVIGQGGMIDGRICSEDAKQAINLISKKSNPGFSPVHVIEASWPMQRCAVNAQLSSERNLTLLEKYTLRSFNEIPNVSAAEIAERLGLKEPELIEEALDSLTRSEALDSHQKESEDQSQQIREEIDLIEFQLNNVFKGAVKNNQNRKLELKATVKTT